MVNITTNADDGSTVDITTPMWYALRIGFSMGFVGGMLFVCVGAAVSSIHK